MKTKEQYRAKLKQLRHRRFLKVKPRDYSFDRAFKPDNFGDPDNNWPGYDNRGEELERFLSQQETQSTEDETDLPF